MVAVVDLKEIVSRGGGIILRARDIPIMDIKEIASRAANSGALVTLRNANHIPVVDLKEIASRSQGHVVLDFTREV